MHFPYRIVESTVSSRDEFAMTDGHQPTHALFYLKKGSFHITIDGTEHSIGVGDCLILPDYLHFRRNVIEPIEFVYVKFTQNSACPYSFPVPHGKVAFRDPQRFLVNIGIIEQWMERNDPLSVNYCEHLLIDILFQAYLDQNPIHPHTDEQPSHNPLVDAAVAHIRGHLACRLSVAEICTAVGTNPSTLQFHFRRELHQSVGHFLTDERMKKARGLLLKTTYSIGEIAARCGFDTVYYFSNTFKKMHGASPSEYRKRV